MIQIVIDIPEKMWKPIKDGYVPLGISKYLKNGIPLPKGHGRLIDADELKLTRHDIHVEEINYLHRCVSIENIDNATTIIEADAEQEEQHE